jgi:hypothetical protein
VEPNVSPRRHGHSTVPRLLYTPPLVQIPACANPIVSQSDTSILFVIPPGAGRGLGLNISVGGQWGSAANVISYNAPTIVTLVAYDTLVSHVSSPLYTGCVKAVSAHHPRPRPSERESCPLVSDIAVNWRAVVTLEGSVCDAC